VVAAWTGEARGILGRRWDAVLASEDKGSAFKVCEGGLGLVLGRTGEIYRIRVPSLLRRRPLRRANLIRWNLLHCCLRGGADLILTWPRLILAMDEVEFCKLHCHRLLLSLSADVLLGLISAWANF
jgi:hypothetical protein